MPSRTKKRRILLWLGELILVLGLVAIALCVAGVAYLHTDDFIERVTALTESVIEDAVGERCDIDRVVPFFFPPRAEIHGLHLWHEDTSEAIAEVSLIDLPVHLSGGIGLGDIRIEELSVVLHLEDGTLREFASLTSSEGDGEALTSLPWQSLRLEGGSITLHHPDGLTRLTGPLVGRTEMSVRRVRPSGW